MPGVKGLNVETLVEPFKITSFLVELLNSQVLLHGNDTKGAIIVTSGSANILKCLHRPVLDATTKLNKVTWCGKFLNLQVRFLTVFDSNTEMQRCGTPVIIMFC